MPVLKRNLKAVLFDFGGVFTESPFVAVDELGRELGAAPGQLQELVFGPYPEDTDHPWHQLERGEIELRTAREQILARGRAQGIEVDLFWLFERLGQSEGPRREMVRRVRALRRRGLRTALVTNNVKEFRDTWRKLLPTDALFEVVVDSSEEGVRKPDPRIFERALERLGGVAPESALFLDDAESNVEAAKRLGIHGVLVAPNPASALAELDALLD